MSHQNLIASKGGLSEELNSLCSVVSDYIPKSVVSTKNRNRTWQYGYNDQYDIAVISKTGQIGDIVKISGLYIALPLTPKECLQ